MLEYKEKLEGPGGAIVIKTGGKELTVTKAMLSVTKETVTKTFKRFTPAVIEPAFGIGRILYTMLEHSYYLRDADDEKRSVFRMPYHIAPVSCVVLPISQQNKAEFAEKAEAIAQELTTRGLTFRVDSSSAPIGKR